jgi:hypothetical protein
MINELISDSAAGLTLEQSEAWRGNRLSAGQAADGVTQLRETHDHTGFHLLMALRRDDPPGYQEIPAGARAAVLAGALAHVQWLNDFGYLDPGGSYVGPAGAALLEAGNPARPYLVELLGDHSPAPLRGSEEATMAKMFGYRRCDFAYRFLTLLTGQDLPFDPDPARRDELITALRK